MSVLIVTIALSKICMKVTDLTVSFCDRKVVNNNKKKKTCYA